jgi:hypothetical protein
MCVHVQLLVLDEHARTRNHSPHRPSAVEYPGIFFGGVQQIQLRTEGREKEDLVAVAPS